MSHMMATFAKKEHKPNNYLMQDKINCQESQRRALRSIYKLGWRGLT